MLITKEVEVKLNSKIKYYEDKGYEIPLKLNSKGKVVKQGLVIKVKIKDLPNSSNAKLQVKCDYCDEIYTPMAGDYFIGHLNIEKDACKKCKHIKTQEIQILKYGTTSIKVRSEIEGFKLGRNKIDGQEVYDNFIKRGYIPKFNPEDYNNCKDKLPYECSKHSDKGTLFISYDAFINFNHGCTYCGFDKFKGENNPNWKGGVTSEYDEIRKSIEYKNWRTKVFQKDNYTCQACEDDKGRNLHAHHIKNFAEYAELRFEVDNGITLCDCCHNPNKSGSFHNVYGVKNNTSEQLEEFIRDKKIKS